MYMVGNPLELADWIKIFNLAMIMRVTSCNVIIKSNQMQVYSILTRYL